MAIVERFIADMPPGMKDKFKEVAKAKDTTMVKLLITYIETEHKKLKK